MPIVAETRPSPRGFKTDSTGVTGILFMMTAALGQRDTYTHAHAQRVAAYSRRIGIQAKLAARDLHNITLGGMLHDVGKLGLSDHIFTSQQAAMSEALLDEVHTHPVIGAEMLRHIQCSKTISEAVLYHHERIDGSGYPFGLRGEEIPLSARIVSVADCFDAITTDRPYQRRKTVPHAIAILNEMAGVCLDADMVAILIEEIQSNGMEPVMPPVTMIAPLAKTA